MSVPTENNFPPFHDYLQKSCPVERPEINGTMYWNKMNGGTVGILPDRKLWAPAAGSYTTETQILWIKCMENEKQYSCLAGSTLFLKKSTDWSS